MTLTVRPTPYVIPEYSLTGDLLSQLTCALQYRYQNKGSLPPATPVQLWFGEFIHGVMEEAYLEWRDNDHKAFPWRWEALVRPIELRIYERLTARNLIPPPNLFCRHKEPTEKRYGCPDNQHPHKLLATRRALEAINSWGPHLFPLISEPEVPLKGLQPMPNYQPNVSRANYYAVTGTADVISSVDLAKAPAANLLLHYIHNSAALKPAMEQLTSPKYEIIIDYKGMRRPPTTDEVWNHHEWQILNYAWLRSKQEGAAKVVAGILIYIDELVPSTEAMKELKAEAEAGETDELPDGLDKKALKGWIAGPPPQLSGPYRSRRSIRIVPVTEAGIQNALAKFDSVVADIEKSVSTEIAQGSLAGAWAPKPKTRTCTACDFKTYCPTPAQNYTPQSP